MSHIAIHSRFSLELAIHLGMDPPSASVTGLALRHAILPKTYPSSYRLHHDWESQGIPQYLYTDSGSDFTSQHLEHIANQLGIVLCHRHHPSQGGIIERPFGTLNQDFFSQLPGYTTARAQPHQSAIRAEASLTLDQLEPLASPTWCIGANTCPVMPAAKS